MEGRKKKKKKKLAKLQLWCFPGGLDGKQSACSVGDPGLIPGLGRSPGKGNGYQFQPFLLGESHGQKSLAGYSPWVAKSQT